MAKRTNVKTLGHSKGNKPLHNASWEPVAYPSCYMTGAYSQAYLFYRYHLPRILIKTHFKLLTSDFLPRANGIVSYTLQMIMKLQGYD